MDLSGMNKVGCILLVDDDPVALFLYGVLLEEMGVANEVQAVDNVTAAVSFIRNRCHSEREDSKSSLLVFLDVNMPDKDGFDFLEEIKHEEELTIENADIFILSSSTHLKDKIKAAAYNIKGYIEKPLTKEKVNKALLEVEQV